MTNSNALTRRTTIDAPFSNIDTGLSEYHKEAFLTLARELKGRLHCQQILDGNVPRFKSVKIVIDYDYDWVEYHETNVSQSSTKDVK